MLLFRDVLFSYSSQSKLVNKTFIRSFSSTSSCATNVKVNLDNKGWKSVVGLEVHAQIKSNSKLFSGAATKFGEPANSLVSLFDCAIPGTLPVLNRKCVEAGVITSLALNCNVSMVSEFDRKHYFYPDMPAGYQITQQRSPLSLNGYLDFIVYNPAAHRVPYVKRSIIKQIQLEQDSGKTLQDDSFQGSLIDLNRAGIGLMEIVFEPDLIDGEEAAALIGELSLIFKRIGTCDAKMEEGSLRVDANVSIKCGDSLGTRTEIKNLNSIRAIAKAVDYEIKRQIKVLENGGTIINETLSFDPQTKETSPMRDKERKQDYRYMPEPNLPPLRLDKIGIDPIKLRSQIPVLPSEERKVLVENYQLNIITAAQLVQNEELLTYFKEVMESDPKLNPKMVCNLFLTDLLGLLNKEEKSVNKGPVSSRVFGEIVSLLQNGAISPTACKELLVRIYHGDSRRPNQIIEEENWLLIKDEVAVEQLCLEVMEENKKAVAAYQSGKSKVLNSLVGQLKKKANNRFDMGLATKMLLDLLNKK